MPLAPEIIAAPLAARGQRLSAAIDKHLANCAGTIGAPGAELAMRGRLVREQADIASEWGHRIASTRLTLSVDQSLLPSAAAEDVTATVVSITSGRGVGRYLIAEVIATDAGRLMLVLQAAPA